ncbi:MAG: MFS transporter [Candidatus Woesearchaeota archaeon]
MAFFHKDELRLLWPFYAESILSTLLFIYPPFWVLYFQSINLSLFQIGVLMVPISVASFLFEIPTGAIADIFGRKFSTLLGYFLCGILVFSIFFFTGFWALFVIFTLWGIAGTFISGAQEAWVADNLKFRGRPWLLKEYYIKTHSFIRLSLLVAGFVGAFLVKIFGLGIIWPITGFSLISSGIILSFVGEKRVKLTCPHNLRMIYDQSKKSIRFGITHHVLFFLFAIVIIEGLCGTLSGEFMWQPFLKNLGFPVYAFGYLFSGLMLIGAFAPYLAKPLLKIARTERALLTIITVFHIALFISVLFTGKWFAAIMIMGLITLGSDIYNPLMGCYFQKFVPSRMRATTVSFKHMLSDTGFAISGPLVGFLGDLFGPRFAIALGGLILVPVVFLYLAIREKK